MKFVSLIILMSLAFSAHAQEEEQGIGYKLPKVELKEYQADKQCYQMTVAEMLQTKKCGIEDVYVGQTPLLRAIVSGKESDIKLLLALSRSLVC